MLLKSFVYCLQYITWLVNSFMLDESTFDKFLKKNTLIANFINMRNMTPVTITVISG